jgi:nucleotide-binding universal stress UspA family protein
MIAPSIEPVVVGVDGTLASIGALDLAADEAMARVAPLVVVYTVAPPLDPRLPQHRRLLDLAVSRAGADHPGLSVSGDLVRGAPVDALVAWSHVACLLVVGHARSDQRSVAEQVAERSAAPVIVHRPFVVYAHPAHRSVLVGVELPGHDGAALPFAFTEAALRGAPLTAMHVWTGQPADRPGVGSPEDAGRLLSDLVAAWSTGYADVAVRREVLRGPTAGRVLAGASQEAALVVVGGHRHGTVGHALIEQAGCPVALIDGPAA